MAVEQVLAVTGMHCASCGLLIDETLEELPGVVSSSTDLRRQATTVEYDPTATTVEALIAEVTSLGYAAHPA